MPCGHSVVFARNENDEKYNCVLTTSVDYFMIFTQRLYFVAKITFDRN